MQYLQQKSGAQTQQEFETYIQQLGEEGLQQEYAQFMQTMKQRYKFGGMLNYIEKLRGVCPEGYEMQFFKQGGQICKKCIQKAKMEEGGKTPENPIDAFRCGRKMKKKACGGSMKKKKISKKLIGGVQEAPTTLGTLGTVGAKVAARVAPRRKIVWSAEDPTTGIDPSGAVVHRTQEAVGALGRRQAMQQFANDVMQQDQNLYNQQRQAVQAAQQKANNFRNKVFNFTNL